MQFYRNSAERRRIIQECSAGKRIEATQLLPVHTASQRTIERKRKQLNVAKPNPPSMAKLICLTLFCKQHAMKTSCSESLVLMT